MTEVTSKETERVNPTAKQNSFLYIPHMKHKYSIGPNIKRYKDFPGN